MPLHRFRLTSPRTDFRNRLARFLHTDEGTSKVETCSKSTQNKKSHVSVTSLGCTSKSLAGRQNILRPSLTLHMEAARVSETLASTYQTIRYHGPEYHIIHFQCTKHLKYSCCIDSPGSLVIVIWCGVNTGGSLCTVLYRAVQWIGVIYCAVLYSAVQWMWCDLLCGTVQSCAVDVVRFTVRYCTALYSGLV